MSKRLIACFAALGLMASLGGTATAKDHQQPEARERAEFYSAPGDNDGTSEGHLPASKKDMRLISKLKLTDIPGGVSDVNYHKGFAYVGKYAPACTSAGATGAGVAVIDVRNPREPRQVSFIRAGEDSYVSEGVHLLTVDTPFFKGDLLLHSNESCGAGEAGGISIYNVNNPAKPKLLVDQFGDTDANDPEDPTLLPFPNAVHSVMGWKDGRQAYAVAVDNFEFLDVDIFDITDPRNPVLIKETGIPDWTELSPQLANGESAFHHDMWVKKIDGNWMMLVSYWDAGWVLLNVDDPANPVFVADSDYPAEDPLMPGFTPEGNAHQAAWSANNKFIVGTDEDFSPNRTRFFIETGDAAGEYPGGEFGWTPQIIDLYPDAQVNGPAVWGGTGCPDDPTTAELEGDVDGNGIADRDDVPDAADFTVDEGEEKILFLTRGTCFFSEKVESGELKGWDVVVVGNSHGGSAGGELPDAILCGSKGHAYEPTIAGGCTGHRAMHLVFDDEVAYEGTEGGDMPALGTVGQDVRLAAQFDGWGYVQLLKASNLEIIDSYAVPEAIDQDYSDIYPLSVHEVKTDWRKSKNLGYVSWYQAGARVLRFGNDGIEEVGHFIDKEGSNFWGVYPIKRGKKRPILLFSDRDFGLYVLKYTGPQ